MQNLIGYSQCMNRSSPFPSSPENVKCPQIFAVPFSALYALVCVETNEILVQNFKWKMYVITNTTTENLIAKSLSYVFQLQKIRIHLLGQ